MLLWKDSVDVIQVPNQLTVLKREIILGGPELFSWNPLKKGKASLNSIYSQKQMSLYFLPSGSSWCLLWIPTSRRWHNCVKSVPHKNFPCACVSHCCFFQQRLVFVHLAFKLHLHKNYKIKLKNPIKPLKP